MIYVNLVKITIVNAFYLRFESAQIYKLGSVANSPPVIVDGR